MTTNASAATNSRELPGIWEDYYAPEFVVRVDNRVVDPTTKGDVLQIGVTLDEENPAFFNLNISDWDDVKLTFKYSSTSTFNPGKPVTIDLGYANRLQRVVTGVITSLSPRFPESGPPTLTVGGQDLMRTMANRHPGDGDRKHYENKTDADIAREIAQRWGMRSDIKQSAPVHPLVVQKQEDAVFLMERAKRIDYEFFIGLDEDTGEEVFSFIPRRDGRDARALQVRQFTWGENLMSFTPRLSSTGQVAEVTVKGWDPRTKKGIEYTARARDLPSSAPPDRSGPAKADSRTRNIVYDSPVASVEEAQRLAISMLMERANCYTKGTAQIIGLPDLRPGDTVNIGGVGCRFNGQYHVKKVVHSLGASGFTTTFDVERPAEGKCP
jgi:phage protein D